MQKGATIKDIAKALQISPSTVSRALHNHASIGMPTRQKVQALAAQMGYVPNLSALSLRQGKSFTIGVILPNLHEAFFSKAVSAIEDTAMPLGYSVLISQTHDQPEREAQVLQAFVRHRVDGLIISLSKHTAHTGHFAALAAEGFPMVFFDRVPPGAQFHSVHSDMYEGTRQAIAYLFEQGHKRIALLNGPPQMISSQQRLEMYKTAMQKRRLKIDMQLVVSTDLSREGTKAAMAELLRLKNKPTAVLVTNDYVAMDAIQYARSCQIRINEELTFVSYANTPAMQYMDHPPIASVEQFPYKQAALATQILFEQIRCHEMQTAFVARQEIVAPQLIIRH